MHTGVSVNNFSYTFTVRTVYFLIKRRRCSKVCLKSWSNV